MNKYLQNYSHSINELTMLFYLITVIFISLIYNNPFILGAILFGLLIVSFSARQTKFFNFCKISITIFIITVMFNLLINQAGTDCLLTTSYLQITTQSLLNAIVLGLSFLNILWAFYLYDALVHSKLIFNILAHTFRSIAVIFILTVKFIPKIMQIFSQVTVLFQFRNHSHTKKISLLERIKKAMMLNEIVLNKSIANFMNMSDALISREYGNQKSRIEFEQNKFSDYLLRVCLLLVCLFDLVMLYLNQGKIDFGSSTVQISFNHWIGLIAVINFLIIIYPLLMGGVHFLWWKLSISKTTVSNTQMLKKFR